ncbi:unnamed protein product [Effrenium voratum]|nr:unnamed protein product [Effrenium voratum]
MVRQEDVDNLFAKPGTARRHCILLSACIIFDVTIYPLMIWFLFIDVPAFLQPPPQEEDERMFLFIKLGAVCGFTFVVCMYQVILFDLFGQHCSRMRRPLEKPVAVTEQDIGAKSYDERPRQDLAASRAHLQDGDIALPGAIHQPRQTMPSIEESHDYPAVHAVMSRANSHSRATMGSESRAPTALLRKYHSEDDGRCFVCSISSGIASLATASCGHLVCSSCSTSKKGGACLNCKPNASKSNEKTVSFDRETVFTYIKQTPETTPR